MVILLNFHPITGYYEKNFDKEFSPETFRNNRPHDPYYILKVSLQTNELFLKCRISKKRAVFGAIMHSKKIGILPNLQKRFQRCLKASKVSKKRIKKSTKPLKVLTVCPGEEPSPAKLFLKFRTAEKGFVGKFETFRVLNETLRNHEGLVRNY